MPEAYEAAGHYEGRVAVKANPAGEFLHPEEAYEFAQALMECAEYVDEKHHDGLLHEVVDDEA